MLTEKVEGSRREREDDGISELHDMKARWDAEFASHSILRILGAKFKKLDDEERMGGGISVQPSILSMLNNAWPLEMSQLGPSPSAATSSVAASH